VQPLWGGPDLIYREEGLNLRLSTRRRKRAALLRVVPNPPSRVHQRWSMDFMMDTLLEGRRTRVLTVVDNPQSLQSYPARARLIPLGKRVPARR
jgi:hypothetical protein